MKLCLIFSLILMILLSPPLFAQPQTVFFEDFENGQGDWYATNGDWQIGIPTYGLTSAYSGQNLAATNLTGKYSPDANTKLVSPAIELPELAAGERLQIKFVHWYSILYGQGRLQVADYYSTPLDWQTLPMVTSFQGSRTTWTQYVADLTAYAGSKIYLAFWFTSGHGGSGERAGWYIDDVLIEKTNTQMPNPESFENGVGDWSATNGDWQVGPHPNFGPKAAHTGQNVVGTILNGNYSPDANTKFISPPLTIENITRGEPIQLRFWHWYSILYGQGQIQVSVNDNDWVTVPNSNSFNGSSTIWTQYIVRLAPYSNVVVNPGSTIRIAFWFTSGHGGSGERAGWYIDDVSIEYSATAIHFDNNLQPLSFKLYEAFPNPFNASTTIQYYLPKKSHIKVEIYNISGQLVRVLEDKVKSAGLYSFVWQAEDKNGQSLPSGTYLCRLKTPNFTQTKKVILLK